MSDTPKPSKLKQMLKLIADWTYEIGSRLRERYCLCDICGERLDESNCPCGRHVCGECQDYFIYTDETCCEICAKELREAWKQCPGHRFGEPYENDDGQTIQQCELCDMPRAIEVEP